MKMASDGIGADEENLRSAAMNGEWKKVLEIFEKKRELRTAKITQTGDTVLHMAVSSWKEHVVESMVDLVCGEGINKQDEKSPLLRSADENGDEKKLVLGAENEKGNTPLHLAASEGSIKMCEKIGRAYPTLIIRRNRASETPLFMAALHSNRKAFLWLHYLYKGGPQGSSTHYDYYKRDDNDTILHCAIAQGNIALAIDIVLLYKDHLKEMTLMRNESGLSPLHLLAATPSAFASTVPPWQSSIVRLIYPRSHRFERKKQATTMEELEYERDRSVAPLIRAYFTDLEGRPKMIAFPLMVMLSLVLFLDKGVLYLVAVFAFLFLLGVNLIAVIQKTKEHTWSLQIREELLQHASEEYMAEIKSTRPPKQRSASRKTKGDNGSLIVETPLMIAAENGVIEIVAKILELFPSAMAIENDEGKNIVLLAVEKRQTKLYQFLCQNPNLDDFVFWQVDKDGNTALHLAAQLGVNQTLRTITMAQEIQWFEFVRNSVPSELWDIRNDDGKTAEEVFRDSYEGKMASDRDWLNQTSRACCVGSTLVVSMAFSNVTSNFNNRNYLSLMALSLSLTSFLGVLAFRSQSLKFWRYSPLILHYAICSMFYSMLLLWWSLIPGGNFYESLAYGSLGLPITLLAIFSLPIFGPTLMSILFIKFPLPPTSSKTTSAIRRYRRPQKKEN